MHHILVVDDDAEIRDTLVELLRDRGYNSYGAADGAAALAVLRTRSPWNLILLDLMMPGMDGWQMRSEQTADPLLSTIPVVVVSATTEVGDTAKMMRADGFLVKPVRLADLLAVVEQFCPRSP